MSSRFRPLLLMLVFALTVASCAQQQDTSQVPAEPATSAAADVSDANIAAIVVNYNNVEIEHAKAAQQKATNPKVKEFAQRMITDHGAVNQQATDLATKLGLVPADNETSLKLTSDGSAFRQSLSAMSGADFDRAYIDNEIALHQAVLDMFDTSLVPSSDNVELKALLEQTRPAVVAHLDHAKQIQSELGGATQ